MNYWGKSFIAQNPYVHEWLSQKKRIGKTTGLYQQKQKIYETGFSPWLN
jgi:hypothetical protein